MAGKYQAGKPGWDSQRIRSLRDHLGLTQQGLADSLGTRQQTISEWELGLYKPRGASATLLSIVAEKARFSYSPGPAGKRSDNQADPQKED